MIKRAKSIIWILVGAGIVLAVGVMLVTGGYANGILRDLAQRALSREGDEVYLIGEIQGNPLGDCRIVDVQIGDWAHVDTLNVAYSFGSLLIGQVVVHRLRLSGIEMRIDASGEDPEAPGWGVPLPLDLDIESLEIANTNVVVGGTQVRDISLKGAIFAGESECRLILERFRSVQFDPPLEVTNLSGIAILQGGDLQLKDVALHTRESRILMSGLVRQLDNPEVDLVVEADSLWLADLRNLVDLPTRAMQVRGNVKGSLQSLVTELIVKDEEAAIAFNGIMGIAPFALRGDMVFKIETDDLISLGYTGGFDTDLPLIRTRLDGMVTFAIDSSGVERAVAEGVFQRVQFGDTRFDSVRFASNLANGLLWAQVTANGPSGNIVGSGEVRLNTWDGEWKMRFRDLHAGHFPYVPEKVGRATGRIDGARYVEQRLFIDYFEMSLQNWGTRVNGSGRLHFEEEKPAIAGDVRTEVALPRLTGTDRWGTSLTLAGNVDGIVGGDLTVELAGNIAGNAAADSLLVSALVNSEWRSDIRADLSGTGGMFSTQGHIDRYSEGQWLMDVQDLEAIGEVIDVDLSGAVALSGTWSGTLDAPGFTAQGSTDSIVVVGIPLQNVAIETRWSRPDSGAVNLKVDRLTWGDRSLQAVFFDAVYVQGETSFLLGSDVQQDNRVLFFGHAGQKEDHFQVAMDSLYVKVDQVVLQNEGPVRFAYSPSHGVHIGHLVLSGPAGRLVARDQQGFQATVEVLLKDLDLRPWAFLAGASGMGGILNGEVLFAGTLTDPLVFGQFSLAKGKISGVGFDSAAGEVSLGNDRIHLELKVVPDGDEVLALFGSFPIAGTGDMHLRARSEGIALRTRPNTADEKTELAEIKRFEEMAIGTVPNALFGAAEGISGMLSFDLEARGRLEKPDIQGVLEIRDGTLHMPDLSRSYAPVSGRAVFGDGKIQIDSLAIGTSANLSGDIILEGFLPSRWDLSAQLRDFEPVALPELQIVTDGQLQLTGTPQGIKVEGKLAMKQAEIRLAELLGVPSLATKQAEIRLTELFGGPDTEMPPFLRDPEIHLQVSADRQVWLRDPTFEVEIGGDLDIIKNREDSRIYGTISSRRGNYILQNRRLRITQGEVQFQGRPDWNPDLDIRAETRVRVPEPVNIIVTVGGTLTYPQISFDSDSSTGGDMGDIAALLLTGRPAGQFEFEHTLDLFAGVVANRLGQHIGQKLHLDLVEIDVGEGNISRVRLGKYIGDRLFMSYAKDISSTAYEAAMEFEILSGLTLEASQIEEVNEGNNQRRRGSVGLFWKKEW